MNTLIKNSTVIIVPDYNGEPANIMVTPIIPYDIVPEDECELDTTSTTNL